MTDKCSSAATTGPLLPCPFCGGPATRAVAVVSDCQIRCENDECIGPHTTAFQEGDAVRQWNTRAGVAQAVRMPSVEEMREAIADGWSLGNQLYDDFDEMMRLRFDAAARAVVARAAQPPAAPVEKEPAAIWADLYKLMCGFPTVQIGLSSMLPADKPKLDDQAEAIIGAALPRISAEREDTTCYIERSKVRELLLMQSTRDLDATTKILRGVDALPIFVAGDFRSGPQTSWQPIETAPKDGTLVLICGFGSEGYYVADAKWDGEWLLFHPDNDDHTEPSYNVSYWMPLPAPPSEVSRPHQRGGE
jgi:hypothetical protein